MISDEAAAAARALLRSRLGQLNAGLDPELMQAGITLGAYHIEDGIIRFTEWARKMIADLGEAIARHLPGLYESIRYTYVDELGQDVIGKMTPPADVAAAMPELLAAPASRATATIEGGDLLGRLAGRDVAIEIEAGGQTMTVQMDAAQALREADALVNALEEIRRRCL